MANLVAIIKELQQERDRLDTSGNSFKAYRSGRTMSAAARRRIAAHKGAIDVT